MSSKAAVKKGARGVLTPKLRFLEFRGTGGWTEKPLKEAALINPSNNGLPESFAYIDLESVVAGELKAKTRISRVGAPSRAQRLIERGDIIYQVVRPYQRNNLLCEFADEDDYVASTGYAQVRAKGSNHFLYQSIHTDSFVGRVMAKCTGSNYPAINSSDLAEIELPLPPTLPEQQKIADCLTSLDEVIAAQSQKLDALKTHKKGLMQQLFPREGETQPRLRFPEFREAGGWEPDTLENLCTAKISYGIVQAGPHVPNGMPYIKSTDLNFELCLVKLSRTSDVIADKYRRSEVVPGDLVFSLRGNIGASQIVPKEIPVANLTQGTARIRTQGPSAFYLHALRSQSVHGRILAVSKGSTFQEISLEALREILLFHPEIPEQKKIASCLSSLDDLITAQDARLETLKTHKKGLMQQLFPSPKEVEV